MGGGVLRIFVLKRFLDKNCVLKTYKGFEVQAAVGGENFRFWNQKGVDFPLEIVSGKLERAYHLPRLWRDIITLVTNRNSIRIGSHRILTHLKLQIVW